MAIRGKSNTPPVMRDLWETDREVVRALEKNLGFRFDIDVCGTPENRRAPTVITVDPRWRHDCYIPGFRCHWDAFLTDWSALGRYAFMNPPFTLKGKFIHRAETMARRGMTIVGLVPVALCAGWYRHMEKGVTRIMVPERRINYVHPMTGAVMRGVNFETLVPIWEPGRPVDYVRIEL